MEKIMSVSEAKMKLNRLVDDVISKDGETLITKNGVVVAALVPAALYEGWKETREIKSDAELLAEIRRGVDRLQRKRRRYSFEEVFGEPPR